MSQILLALLATFTAVSADTVFRDDFSDSKKPERRALRGDWKFSGGVAACTQDDELYKKFKNHGPVLFYDVPFDDAVVRFSFKADGCKLIAFTANGPKGHVFRVVLSENASSIRAFPPDKPIGIAEGPPLKSGEWVEVVVTLRGPKATVKIGDFEKTVEHATYAAPKTNVSVGFGFGTLAVKNFSVEKLERAK